MKMVSIRMGICKVPQWILVKKKKSRGLPGGHGRVHLLVQETWFQPWCWRIPCVAEQQSSCTAATEACALGAQDHSYWACALEPRDHSYWVCALSPGTAAIEPMYCNYRSPCSLEHVLEQKKPLQWEACTRSLER